MANRRKEYKTPLDSQIYFAGMLKFYFTKSSFRFEKIGVDFALHAIESFQ